ncbi:hypothetical protein O8B93_21785 [Agrobacterium rhizogenes]|uniref:hypothetical protein n=1 Tax=Rhizobium rhizogenes TaxID=359 RepID=UPI0022B6B23C|nr:hypothetical protein [Rhizobium rhizogenes]MCZ7450221.1 hypothetical protein [Rhizobium rhizogenes]
MDANLPDGIYPLIDKRLPLAELVMIEVPLDLETLLRTQAAANGTDLIRGEPVELTCRTAAYGDATFLVYWPHEQDRLHMLTLKRFKTGTA